MLSSLLFARKIRDENVSTIPELVRKHLGNKCANADRTAQHLLGVLCGGIADPVHWVRS